MKILFLTTTFPRFAGDSQSPFVLEQAIAWKKERPTDDVIILAPGDAKAKSTEVIEDVKIERFDYFWPRQFQLLAYPAILPNIKRNPLLLLQLPFLFLAQLLYVIRYTLKYKVDLIYAHWTVPQGLIAFLTYNVKRVTYIVHNHSSDLRLLIKIPLVGKFLARKIIQNSKYFFCVNETLKKEALNLVMDSRLRGNDKRSGNDKVLYEDKIKVMTMGISKDNRSQMSDKPETRLLRPAGPRNDTQYDFGFLGRLTEKKGARQFLNAVYVLKSKLLVGIAGAGEESTSLEREIADARSQIIDVRLLGNLSGEAKNLFMMNTKIFVFPSLSIGDDIEGLPVALLEALSANKIVVASRATNAEQMTEWDNIKSNVLLLKDPTNKNEFATILSSALQTEPKDISRWMKKYEWRSLIREYIELINPTKLGNGSPPSRG